MIGTPIFDAVIEDVGFRAACIYGVIARHSRFSGNRCQVSIGVIARECGFSRRTIMHHLPRLEQGGWLIRLAPKAQGALQEYLCKAPEGQLALAEECMGSEEQDAWVCRECGSKRDLHLDHIKPRSKGGDNRPENLQILCCACNARKAARWPG